MKIIEEMKSFAEVNESLKGVIDIAHFNDEAKIGKDKEMVDKLTKHQQRYSRLDSRTA